MADNVIQAVELKDEDFVPANTQVTDANQAIRIDSRESASSEAEDANRSIDERDPDFQQAEIVEGKDRLGIVKDPPDQTSWTLDIKRDKEIADKRKMEMVIEDESRGREPVKEKKPEPKYPFNVFFSRMAPSIALSTSALVLELLVTFLSTA